MKDLKKVTDTKNKGNLQSEKSQSKNKNGKGPKNQSAVVNEEEQEVITDESNVKSDIFEAGKKEKDKGREKKEKEDATAEKMPNVDAEKNQITNAEADIINKKE